MFEIKIILWLFASILIVLSVLGFAGRAELKANASPILTGPIGPAAPLPAAGHDEPPQVAHLPPAAKTSLPPPPDIASPESYAPPQNHEPASSQSARSGPKCPLGRVAMVRGSDSEASEGGGFYAARKNGIHGAVDLDGSVGEAVFAVASGKVIVVGDWGKLGKAVILDHLDSGYTIYGHLHTVTVNRNSSVAAGLMIGTIGYSGNAKNLQKKNLPPHLHFAYVRGAAPLVRIRDSVDGLVASFARRDALAGGTGVLDPIWAVGFNKCWEDPTPSKPSTVAMP